MRVTDIPEDVKFKNVTVQLIGVDGNAFVLMGQCQNAIRRVHGREAASRWLDQAKKSESYDDMLQFMLATLDVE